LQEETPPLLRADDEPGDPPPDEYESGVLAGALRLATLKGYKQIPTLTAPVLAAVLAAPPKGWGAELLRRLSWLAWQLHQLNDMAENMRYWLRATTTVSDEQRSVAAHSKNKKPRIVPLTGELRALLERRKALRRLDCPLVFHRGAGEPLGDFRKVWASSCAAAHVPGLLFHDLRRSAVRIWCGPASPSAWRWRSPGTRHARCSTATTS
jgi:integrase